MPKRLKAAREGANVARQPLSLAAGLSNNTVHGIEIAGRVPSVETLERIANVLKVSPCWLAFGEEQAWRESAKMHCSALPARLRAARELRGLSRHALGKAAGKTGTTVQSIEDGLSMPGVDTVEQLAKSLKVTPCWLAYGQGSGPGAGPEERHGHDGG